MNRTIFRFYQFANNPSKGIWLSDIQAHMVFSGAHIQCGLPMDTYISLIDPNWPID